MNALEIKNLSKTFATGFEIRDLNLTLPSGCIMGLIGENGAGKSTLTKLILDLLHKDGGSITILGKNNEDDIRLTKEDIGVVLDEMGIPECLDAGQVGKIMSYTYKNWDQKEYERLLERFCVPDTKEFKELSRGMKMKLGLAIAMAHHSRLLLLDEATNGLDPVARDDVLDLLSDFTRDEDHSVLISSHIVSDLEKICDYVAFLHQGRLLICEEKDLLLAEYGIIHCSSEQLRELDVSAILHKKETPYGAEAILRRDRMPAGMSCSPVSIEELFVYMVKGER